MNEERQLNQWGQIVAKAWQDDAFKKRLIANPVSVLKDEGLEVPSGTQIRVVENTDQVIYLTLPAKPSSDELSVDDLELVAGGFCFCRFCVCRPAPTPTSPEDIPDPVLKPFPA